MQKILVSLMALLMAIGFPGCETGVNYRTISVEEYRSKMTAGWLGQMAGVGWGASTEFKYNGVILPDDEIPAWEPTMLNQQFQDDIYVEMTFLKTLDDYGFDVSIRQAGIDFANSRYRLAHANEIGRDNLRSSIAPPFSGHPDYNSHADDIDYQIEADYSGLIAPGMPQIAIDLGEKFGRIMNYGDGLHGGQFVGAMYAEAFFENDIGKLIDAGLAAIPASSQYAEMVRDVVKWYGENPNDWRKTWGLIEDKYNRDHNYRKFSCNGTSLQFNIDAKINGAYIVMGLLYGGGDMDRTIIISMQCGQDSDCNPSNAAGILATSLGLEKLPAKYKTGIDTTTKFEYTTYDFPTVLEVCERLARKAVERAGGSVGKNSAGIEEFVIASGKPVVTSYEPSWAAAEIKGNVNFTEEEMTQIEIKIRKPEEFVNVWHAAGPFSKVGVEGFDLFDVTFEPERNDEFNDWEKLTNGVDGIMANFIDLEKLFRVENSVVYLKTHVWAAESRQCIFEIGSDDGVKVWLNNKLIHQNNVIRGHTAGEDQAEAELKGGVE
ncbi:ADP-ribosylglycohydrolase family protein [Candidatus Neomarinimicrobiota bacterium]